MDIYHTIIRPIVTEKSSHQANTSTDQHGATYTFEVRGDANKAEIRDAVQKIYGVHVINVRTNNRLGKIRRFRQYIGMAPTTKRAMVTVDKNSHIDLF